jgi:rubrerythrin
MLAFIFISRHAELVSMSQEIDEREVRTGKTVYDGDGEKLGVVRGFDEHGFYVTATEDVTVLPEDPSVSDSADALMWRCWECGEMGKLAGIPEECPSCGAPKEDIYYWQED